jgi:hypothetical protein
MQLPVETSAAISFRQGGLASYQKRKSEQPIGVFISAIEPARFTLGGFSEALARIASFRGQPVESIKLAGSHCHWDILHRME